jgi:predicted nucleic acid-binding protein
MSQAFFLDSSVIAKRYLDEVGSAWLRTILTGEDVELFAVRIAAVEVVSALSRRRRSTPDSITELDRSMVDFRNEFDDMFDITEVSSDLIVHAMTFAEQHSLRAYDAVQLAAVVNVHEQRQMKGLRPLTFLSSDRILNEAARREGLLVDDPGDHSSP